MPDSPSVWIVLIIAAALVVGLMVWLGRGGSFSYGALKARIDPPKGPGPQVKVANELEVEGGKVGNIRGVSSTDPAGASVASTVEVANKAKFKNANVGDISGVTISGANQEGKQ